MREPGIKFQPKSEDFFCNNKGWVIMEIFVVLNILLPLASLLNSGIFEKKNTLFSAMASKLLTCMGFDQQGLIWYVFACEVLVNSVSHSSEPTG